MGGMKASYRSRQRSRRRVYQSIRDRHDGLSGERILQGEIAAPGARFFSILGQDGFCGRQRPEIKSISRYRRAKNPLENLDPFFGCHNTTSYTVDGDSCALRPVLWPKSRVGAEGAGISQAHLSRAVSGIRTGKINAVFDEGLHNWLDAALDHGFEVLPLEPRIVKQLSALGYQASVIPSAKFTQLEADVNTIDFSGWPLITHRGLSNDLAYSICQAIDSRQSVIPVDDDNPLDMRKICRGTRPRRWVFLCIPAPSDTTRKRLSVKSRID